MGILVDLMTKRPPATGGCLVGLRAYRDGPDWEALPLKAKVAIVEALDGPGPTEKIIPVAGRSTAPDRRARPTKDQVLRRQAEWKAEGRHNYGYGTLAKEFMVSTTTIRRVLERIE